MEKPDKEDNLDDFLAMMADEAGLIVKTDDEILNPVRKDKAKIKTVLQQEKEELKVPPVPMKL